MYAQKVLTGRGDITHNLLLYRKDTPVDVRNLSAAVWREQAVTPGKAMTLLPMDITVDYKNKAPCARLSNAIVDGQYTFYVHSPYHCDLDVIEGYKRGPGESRGPAYDRQRSVIQHHWYWRTAPRMTPRHRRWSPGSTRRSLTSLLMEESLTTSRLR